MHSESIPSGLTGQTLTQAPAHQAQVVETALLRREAAASAEAANRLANEVVTLTRRLIKLTWALIVIGAATILVSVVSIIATLVTAGD
jgi:hypothetical protein